MGVVSDKRQSRTKITDINASFHRITVSRSAPSCSKLGPKLKISEGRSVSCLLSFIINIITSALDHPLLGISQSPWNSSCFSWKRLVSYNSTDFIPHGVVVLSRFVIISNPYAFPCKRVVSDGLMD